MHIILIENEFLFADALRAALLHLAEVNQVEIYANADEILNRKNSFWPDILIMSVTTEVARLSFLKLSQSTLTLETKIIVLTEVADVRIIEKLIYLGVSGIVSRSTSIKEFEECVSHVASGGRYLEKSYQQQSPTWPSSLNNALLSLSNRENLILQKLCGGNTINQIAIDLGLSVYTIQYFHRNLMLKFEATDSLDLVIYAKQQGFC